MGIIKKLKKKGLTQEEIGEKMGWSRNKVAHYNILLENIVTRILNLTKAHQKDHVTDNVTNVTNFHILPPHAGIN